MNKVFLDAREFAEFLKINEDIKNMIPAFIDLVNIMDKIETACCNRQKRRLSYSMADIYKSIPQNITIESMDLIKKRLQVDSVTLQHMGQGILTF
jgi:hypothetical protein